ncbi:hypothetical protein F3Y22_tig00110547pilonHSYRG00009 [Hibiscus syriacus]|uniref:Uncharacterized protein n=1 Tax=Hibiscus syriacus TaxID=106335 RepID=A0A6A3AAK3_HIBSY|nr:hypothetical protein F3Y22_tig00110547pilonHSYRG00009 [Hibiscus syriacus]
MVPLPPSQPRNPRRFAATCAVAASSVSHSTVPPSTSRFTPLPHGFSLDSAKDLEARVKELKVQVSDLKKREQELKMLENALTRGRSSGLVSASTSFSGKEKHSMETEKERTKSRKRHMRVFTRRMLAGLRHYVRTGGKHKVRKSSAVQAIPALPIADIDLVGTKESTTIGHSNEKFSEVKRRRKNGVHNSSKEDQPRISNGFRNDCYTIFIENLPATIHWKRLGSIFGIHDQVIDAFIPNKRTRKGCDSLRMVKDEKLETLAEWFSRVETWSESLVVECRRVWLVAKVFRFTLGIGIPSKNITTKWGKLVAIDNSCEFPSSFDRTKIQILTKAQGRIDELIELKVGDNLFKIMVHEVDHSFKPNSWVPEDCDISLELYPSIGS